MKRLLDIVVSFCVLTALFPLLLVVALLIYAQDRHSPFYVANRVARGGKTFRMVKFRSMIINAAASGVASTSADDRRITPVGHFVRKTKLDEIPQLWNVLKGDMSLVGPRPQVPQDVALYTDEEKGLLTVRPGITDFSSIVFADEGDILEGRDDPDLSYQQLIRPWKSRLGLFYIETSSVLTDLRVIFLTVRNSLDRRATLDALSHLLNQLGADGALVEVARREEELRPFPPPGTNQVFTRERSPQPA